MNNSSAFELLELMKVVGMDSKKVIFIEKK